MTAYLVVEGHGEVAAAANPITRVSASLGLALTWSTPIRWPALNTRRGVERAARFVAAKPDVDSLLVLRDEDDLCPRERGPQTSAWLRELALPFPSAVVLLHPEYEVLFLPCIERMAGKPLPATAGGPRPGLRADARWNGHWERRRGIKEWLSKNFSGTSAYKPTLDQLPLTRMVDLDVLRAAGVPCFETLERALKSLDAGRGGCDVYPSPAADE